MMDATTFEAQYPKATAQLRAQGATQERARILGIDALARGGDEKPIAEMKADPTCTVETARQVLSVLTAR